MYLSMASMVRGRGRGWSSAMAARLISGMACSAGLPLSCGQHNMEQVLVDP